MHVTTISIGCQGDSWGSVHVHAVTISIGCCQGDSGGPVHVGNTVVGLASFVASGCLVK